MNTVSYSRRPAAEPPGRGSCAGSSVRVVSHREMRAQRARRLSNPCERRQAHCCRGVCSALTCCAALPLPAHSSLGTEYHRQRVRGFRTGQFGAAGGERFGSTPGPNGWCRDRGRVLGPAAFGTGSAPSCERPRRWGACGHAALQHCFGSRRTGRCECTRRRVQPRRTRLADAMITCGLRCAVAFRRTHPVPRTGRSKQPMHGLRR